jgi:hypothetical protein
MAAPDTTCWAWTMAAVGVDRKDLAIWTSPVWAAAAPFLFLGGEGWGRATAADAAVANDLASEGKGHLQEHANRAFLTGRQRLAGSEVALEEQGRGPDPEGQGGGEGALAGGAWVRRLSIRAQRAMD